jgi:23S rRNA (pseudouridine1915-N3)-methyltransferase
MNINILCVGKIREKYIKSGIEEYLKRIEPYSGIKITEIQAEKIFDETDEKYLIVEAEKILGKINENSFVIALDSAGKNFDSPEFASQINNMISDGYNQIIFVIGGSSGLAQSVKNRADLLLSFSKMTFPHQLIRLMLVEQIYRAFRIIRGEPYHK